jgi:hypothetical protein
MIGDNKSERRRTDELKNNERWMSILLCLDITDHKEKNRKDKYATYGFYFLSTHQHEHRKATYGKTIHSIRVG